VKICLIGASFDTGNLGVSALAESSIKIILNRWPDAQITLLNSGYTPTEQCLTVSDKEINIKNVPIRFSINVFVPYHFLWFVLYALLIKVLLGFKLKEMLANRNRYFKILYEANHIVDITGGDSFSDIYGFKRFFLGFLVKWLVIFSGKDLVLLPQTYGPFKRSVSQSMARYILRKAMAVYSRDKEGIECVKQLFKKKQEIKAKLCPDVAFILDPKKPKVTDMAGLNKYHTKDSVVIGVNISGLLFNGGYTQNNMFGLKTDYRQLTYSIIEMLLKKEKSIILLIPHVFSPPGYEVESDPDACLKVYQSFKEKYKDRIFLVRGEYNQNEIKHIIGTCDFFIGSRMHSCIAATSQCIPAVGLAYSKKFMGVFESIGMSDCVADIRKLNKEQLFKKIESIFIHKDHIRKHLENVIPGVKKRVLNIFTNL